MSTTDLWTYSDSTLIGNALVGLDVEATDGEIGKIDEATDDAGTSGIVVDTGSWILEEKVYVNRTKDEIKNAPKYDESRRADEAYRAELGAYYGDRGER